jgi:opacity protein-like surface antigen
MRFTLFAAAALVALGQPVYAQDTAQKNAESADTQGQMEADGKKTQSQSGTQDKADTKTATAEAQRHYDRKPGSNGGGGGMNSNAGRNNGNAADQFDPIRGTTTGQP